MTEYENFRRELSCRASNALVNLGINSLEELVSFREADLLRQVNFGRKSLTEIKEALWLRDLTLEAAPEHPADHPCGKELFRRYKTAKIAWDAYRREWYRNKK